MNKIMLLVFLTIIMIAVAVPFVIRSFLWNRVLKLLHNGQYDKVLIMLNSKAFQLFLRSMTVTGTRCVFTWHREITVKLKNRPKSCLTAD